MEDNTKKSPLKKDSLRYAGESLRNRIENDIYSEVLTPVIVIILLFVITVLEWVRAYFKAPYMPWLYTAITVIFIIYYGIKIRLSVKDIRNKQLGLRGERIVAESLEELRTIGYKVYNDIVGESFNIDHIIVGPAGVFTIETKTYRKQVGSDPQITYDGIKIEIGGQKLIGDPIKQAKGQMYWLEGFIKDKAKITVKVRPVVVFPGWFVNQKGNNSEVWVLNEKALSAFLKNEGIALNQEQINLITSHIENYIRSN